jgi:hypothetical protein
MAKKSLIEKAKIYVVEHDGQMINLGDEIERLRGLLDQINSIEQNAYSLRDCDQGMKAIRKLFDDYTETS